MKYMPVVKFIACLGVEAYLTSNEIANNSRYPKMGENQP